MTPKKIALLTDSSADLRWDQARENNIFFVPLRILCEDGEYPTNVPTGRAAALACGTLGTVYALWLIYATGLHYLLMATIIVAAGVPVFIWSRKQAADGKPVFLGYEKVILTILLLVALFAVFLLARGHIHL